MDKGTHNAVRSAPQNEKRRVTLNVIADNLTWANCSSRNLDTIQYIVLHYTGVANARRREIADGMRDTQRKERRSTHYIVDGQEIEQIVDDRKRAWHCGDGKINPKYARADLARAYDKARGTRKRPENATTLGIEMCVTKPNRGRKVEDLDWTFKDDTVYHTAELVAFLMQKHEIPIERVIRHADVSGKPCPRPFVSLPGDGDTSRDESWAAFKSTVETLFETTKFEMVRKR